MNSKISMLAATLIVCLSLMITACGKKSAPVVEPGRVSLIWQVGLGANCGDANVSLHEGILAFRLLGQAGVTVEETTATCSAGEGSGRTVLANIEPGAYDLVAEAYPTMTMVNPTFRGTASGIIVKSGSTTTVSGIRLVRVPDSPAEVRIQWYFIGRMCGTTPAITSVRLYAYRDRIYEDINKEYQCELAEAKLLLKPAEYGFIIEALAQGTDSSTLYRGVVENKVLTSGVNNPITIELQAVSP